MRDIKFRGFREQDKQWIYGSCVELKNGQHVILSKNEIERDGHHIMLDMDDIPTWFDEETFGEYTGLHDKNKKDIYDGDIIKYKDKTDNGIGLVRFYAARYEVVWIDKSYLRKDLYFWAKKREIEIIGNIYENPELIERED